MVNTAGPLPGPRLSPSHAGIPSDITTASAVRFYDKLHLTDMEAEAQRGGGICLKTHSRKVAELGSESMHDHILCSSAYQVSLMGLAEAQWRICNE